MTHQVILLHGLARSERSMASMAKALTAAGYTVNNCGYASTRLTIQQAADQVLAKAVSASEAFDKVHFVTHSMGGLVLRYYLELHTIANLGRIVMLAPPNQGSIVADKLRHFRLFQSLFGPAGQQLGTAYDSLPRQLGPGDNHIGVIAGTRAWNPLFIRWLKSPHDGTLTVDSTRLAGISDHLSLKASHPFIMQNREAIRQTLHFLELGVFKQGGKHC